MTDGLVTTDYDPEWKGVADVEGEPGPAGDVPAEDGTVETETVVADGGASENDGAEPVDEPSGETPTEADSTADGEQQTEEGEGDGAVPSGEGTADGVGAATGDAGDGEGGTEGTSPKSGEGETGTATYDYFITDGDAWLREPDDPSKFIDPTQRAILGTRVALLEELEEGGKKVAKLKIKSSGDTIFITNEPKYLKKIEKFDKDRKYKLLRDQKALAIPFPSNESGKTYKKDAAVTVDKYFGDYVKTKDGETGEHWMDRSLLIWSDPIAKKDFLDGTDSSVKVGTKYTGNKTDAACNICVRSALLIMKEDRALFSKEGSAFYDPAKAFEVSYPKGHITDPGRAENIKEDFDAISTKADLNVRFTEIAKKGTESLEAYFKRLQDKADAGRIVIGAMLSSTGTSGHVVMVTPGGLVDIDNKTNKWGSTFTTERRNIFSVPRVLECGTGARENEAPLCRNVDYNGAKKLNWYEYKF